MRRLIYAVVLILLSLHVVAGRTNGNANVVCKDGMCFLVEDDAQAAATATNAVKPSRIAHGYMDEREFLDFLSGAQDAASPVDFSSMGPVLAVLVVLLGGLALNLTPCVLPMVPVNLMIIGKSARRGAVYGLGMMLSYGVLGLAAALGGVAFGVIQSNPWFNLVVSGVFLVLALALSGVLHIDFSGCRSGIASMRGLSNVYAFLMGGMSAVLAGACVAPVLIAVLLFTANLYAAGNSFALALPFVMGLGMALPWPLAGAGMKVLPRPGAWMKWVNRAFAAVILAFSLWYAHLSFVGFSLSSPQAGQDKNGVVEMTCENFGLEGLKPPVLVDCWASWCKNCSAMDAVLSRPEVSERLQKFTFVKLQAEDLKKLVKIPGFEKVRGLPAFVVFE